MSATVVAILGIVVGLLLCLRGYRAARTLLSLWGSFVGLVLGAYLVAEATGTTVWSTPLAWVVGLALALVFGALAYLWYAVGVIIGVGTLGFTAAGGVMRALGSPQWAVLTVAAAVAVILAVVAIRLDAPAILLVVLTTLVGASLVVVSAMVLTGAVDVTAIDGTAAWVATGWWWTVAEIVLIGAGLVSQTRGRTPSPRGQWAH